MGPTLGPVSLMEVMMMMMMIIIIIIIMLMHHAKQTNELRGP
jgi:hypothetical protein